MSFILDAIKKSDQQRQRGATPTLLTVPGAGAEQRSPAKFTYWVLAAVTLCAGIAIGWLRPWQAEKPAPAESLAPSVKPVQQAGVNLRPPAVAAPVMQPQTVHVPPAPLPRIHAKTAEIPHKAAPASATGEAVVAKAAPAPAALPLRDLPLDVQRQIPEMRIAMHAYSPRPGARIVSINDRLLHEGDSVADGVKLEEITPDGMIFSYKEFRFRRGVR